MRRIFFKNPILAALAMPGSFRGPTQLCNSHTVRKGKEQSNTEVKVYLSKKENKADNRKMEDSEI